MPKVKQSVPADKSSGTSATSSATIAKDSKETSEESDLLSANQDSFRALLEGFLVDDPDKDFGEFISEHNISKFGILVTKLPSLDQIDASIKATLKDDGAYLI